MTYLKTNAVIFQDVDVVILDFNFFFFFWHLYPLLDDDSKAMTDVTQRPPARLKLGFMISVWAPSHRGIPSSIFKNGDLNNGISTATLSYFHSLCYSEYHKYKDFHSGSVAVSLQISIKQTRNYVDEWNVFWIVGKKMHFPVFGGWL